MDTFTQSVQAALQSAGWNVTVKGQELHANRDDITAKWWFGSRKVSTTLRCVFDFTDKVLRYREIAKDVATGIPPPALSLSTHKQVGVKVNIDRQEHSPAGSGTMHYGRVRTLLEHICQKNGWKVSEQLII